MMITPSSPGTGLRSGHGLGTLIQVLVQGIAAVAGNNDVTGDAGTLAPFPDEGDACGVGLLQITGPGGNDLLSRRSGPR